MGAALVCVHDDDDDDGDNQDLQGDKNNFKFNSSIEEVRNDELKCQNV